MKHLYIAIIGLFILVSCKNDKNPTIVEDPMTDTEVKAKLKYKLSPFSKSQEYNDANLSNMRYKEGKFAFDVTGDKYKLGMQTPDAGAKMCANSAKGQHIHLIINNEPYAAKYEAEFDYDVADGEHTILAFLSRSYHESIKTKQAHILKNVTVKDKAIISAKNIIEPMVTYSRPKGTYIGNDAKKVMLDYYVSNASLGVGGYSIQANINGETHIINKWEPMYIEGLPMGENKITLSFMKGDNLINKVTRIFMLKEDANPEN